MIIFPKLSLTEFVGMDLEMAIDNDYHEGKANLAFFESIFKGATSADVAFVNASH